MTRIESVGANVAAHTVLLFVVLGAAVPASSQTGTEPHVWTAVSVQGRVGGDSPWRWAADSMVRTRNGASDRDFMAEWFSVTRDLTRQSSVGVGYAYGAAFPGSRPLREQRFVQHHTWSTGVDWRVSFRTQLEERFVSGQDNVLIRLRQQVRTTWPLAEGGSLRGVASGEVFFKANRTMTAARGFDSSQVFVGVGSKVTERYRVEAGYVNVYTPGTSRGKRLGHVMSATLVVSM
jgi:uncharacterized protein DUF2490